MNAAPASQYPACALRPHVVLERDSRELEAESELNPANDALGDDACQPGEHAGGRQDQHDNADGESRAVQYRGRRLLSDHDGGHRLERLDRHGHAVHQAGQDLHGAEHDQHAGATQMRGQRDADEEGDIGAHVAEGTGQLVAVEPNTRG